MNITLNYWKARGIERIYVNDENRNSLGYFQLTESTSQRNHDSYYNTHRIAKGDTMESTFKLIYVSQSDVSLYAILDALKSQKPDNAQELTGNSWNGVKLEYNNEIIDIDWFALAQRARNGYPCWYGNTPKNDRKRFDKMQNNMIYAI